MMAAIDGVVQVRCRYIWATRAAFAVANLVALLHPALAVRLVNLGLRLLRFESRCIFGNEAPGKWAKAPWHAEWEVRG